MRDLIDYPRLAAVRHKELYCLPEMVPFYARHGFSEDLGGIAMMRQADR